MTLVAFGLELQRDGVLIKLPYPNIHFLGGNGAPRATKCSCPWWQKAGPASVAAEAWSVVYLCSKKGLSRPSTVLGSAQRAWGGAYSDGGCVRPRFEIG